MDKKPLLSICIPTYNRAQYLQKSLESIVNQNGFNAEDVEIVISDNCSTDNTEKVCRNFVSKYSNIFYFRNDVNIRDENFPTVIAKANGVYRKLCNDTLIFREGSLIKILDIIKDNLEDKPVLFFDNMNNGKPLYFSDLNVFLFKMTYWITSITCFGIWSEDYTFDTVNCDLNLWQVSFLIKNLLSKKKSVVIRQKLFITQEVQKKDVSYGLYKVFHDNFLGIVSSFTEVKKNTIEKLEKDLLFKFFPFWIYKYDRMIGGYQVNEYENFKMNIYNTYSLKSYYVLFQVYYKFYFYRRLIASICKKILRIV